MVGAVRVKAGYRFHPGVHRPERKHVTWLGNQARLEQSGREMRVQEGELALGPEAHSSGALPEQRGWIGLPETWGHRRQTTPFTTVPAAESPWTLVTSHSLPWCIYFLLLPSGKAVISF